MTPVEIVLAAWIGGLALMVLVLVHWGRGDQRAQRLERERFEQEIADRTYHHVERPVRVLRVLDDVGDEVGATIYEFPRKPAA